MTLSGACCGASSAGTSGRLCGLLGYFILSSAADLAPPGITHRCYQQPAELAVEVDHAAGPGTMMELYLSMQSSTSLRALLAVRLKGLGTQVRAWLGSKHRRLAVGSHVHSFFCSLFL